MKNIIIWIIVGVVVVAAITAGIIWFARSHYAPQQKIVIAEGDVVGLSWSQSASYAEGCFSFYLRPDENGERWLLTAHCFSEKKGRYLDSESRKISSEDWLKVKTLIDRNDLVEYIETPTDGDLIALDSTTSSFFVQKPDGSSIEIITPENSSEIYELLVGLAG